MKCKICNKDIGNMGFASHLKHHNIKPKVYYDKYEKQEGDGICPVCKQETKFLSVFKGYAMHCNSSCASKNLIIRKRISEKIKSVECQNKIRQTKKERYGSETYNNTEKNKQTCLNRYGVEHQWQRAELREKAFSEEALSRAKVKRENTNLKKYGVKNYTQSNDYKIKLDAFLSSRTEEYKNEIKNRIISNNREKYGVDYPAQLNEISQKISNTKQDKKIRFEIENNCTMTTTLIEMFGQGWYKSKIGTPFLYDDNGYAYVENSKIIDIELYVEAHINCTSSLQEKEVLQFIQSIYEGEIIENSRKIIPPYEIDIFIPGKNIAVEFDGIYFHSVNNGTSKMYHINKTNMCENRGIKLIHINEWEWENKQEVCKSIIAKAMGIYDMVNASDCEIRVVNKIIAQEFLSQNSISTDENFSIATGLFYNNSLVQLVCTEKTKTTYKLLIECTKLNTMVNGGLKKILNYYNNKMFIYYVDRSKYTTKEYEKLGFKLYTTIEPQSTFYSRNNNIKISEVHLKAEGINNFLSNNIFDKEKTDAENMMDNGWLQVYDCGQYEMRYGDE